MNRNCDRQSLLLELTDDPAPATSQPANLGWRAYVHCGEITRIASGLTGSVLLMKKAVAASERGVTKLSSPDRLRG